jgi:uncharacterized damage-inducible protein DinB
MSDFASDKSGLMNDLTQSRAGLVAVVEGLAAEDLQHARRGSWPVSKVLDHVLHSERLYTQLVSVFTGKSTDVPEPGELADAGQAVAALNASRQASTACRRSATTSTAC